MAVFYTCLVCDCSINNFLQYYLECFFMLDWLLLFVICLLSLVIAVLGILAGFGGGIILVPFLTLFFNLPLKLVIGSVIISLWVPAFIGAFGAWRRNEVDFKLGLLFEVPTSLGAIIGAKVTTILPEVIIRLTFGGIALLLSYQMYKKASMLKKAVSLQDSKFWSFIGSIPPVVRFHTNDEEYCVSISSLLLAGSLIGFLAGMLGVGGGWIKTPLLVLGFGVPPNVATGTALFMIFITSLVGGITHYFEGNVDLSLSGVIMIGLGIGAIIGNYLKPRFKNYEIAYIISVILLFVSLIMLYQGFFS